jgi:hypothetical protein
VICCDLLSRGADVTHDPEIARLRRPHRAGRTVPEM